MAKSKAKSFIMFGYVTMEFDGVTQDRAYELWDRICDAAAREAKKLKQEYATDISLETMEPTSVETSSPEE